ncbi:MAG TPA: serine hydrolase domain-containing protein [Anaeromyxobacteraceae bacterium]|nr:serine hydrolase domain-containing protein [Anaeromyxobacteraceae bacterium]
MTPPPVLAGVSALLEAALSERIAPALGAAVLRGGAPIHLSSHGEIPAPAPRPLLAGDLFDVASLTKVMATTSVAVQLVAEGRLELDAPAARWLPGLDGGGRERITVRHLLAHSSGLPGYRPLFERAMADPVAGRAFLPPEERPPFEALEGAFARGEAILREAVLNEPLEAAPGARAVYSDLGFLALGWIVEAAGGDRLSRLASRRVFGPLGLRSTGFIDGLDPGQARAFTRGRAFAPTERCVHRREVNQGAVNDDNAWAAGGCAGHAGLFSTPLDVALLGQAWLDALRGGRGVIPREAVPFARRDASIAGSTRALGWDTPSAEGSTIGTRLGRGRRGAVGHLGWTGCSLWIDVDQELVCALLTNHCHPGGSDRARLNPLRARFHDAVAAGLGIG